MNYMGKWKLTNERWLTGVVLPSITSGRGGNLPHAFTLLCILAEMTLVGLTWERRGCCIELSPPLFGEPCTLNAFCALSVTVCQRISWPWKVDDKSIIYCSRGHQYKITTLLLVTFPTTIHIDLLNCHCLSIINHQCLCCSFLCVLLC